MMRLRYIIGCIGFLFCLGLQSVSAQLSSKHQRLIEISKSMTKYYEEHTSFQYSMNQRYYMNSLDSKPIGETYGVLIHQGDCMIQQLGDVKTIQTPDYTFMVNEVEQVFFLSRVVRINGGEISKPINFSLLDSSLQYVNVIKMEEKGKVHEYEIEIEEGEVERFYLSYDANTFLPKRMVVQYREQQSIYVGTETFEGKPIFVVDYSNQSTTVNLSPEDFTYKKYLEYVNGVLKPLSAYSHFQFTDTGKGNLN